MSRRKRPQPEHRSPHEQRLREIVDEIVPDDYQKQAYLAFAHELVLAERHSASESVIPREPIRQAQGRLRDSRNLAANRSMRDPSTSVGVTGPMSERPRPFPDYSARTKDVVAKWFRRGLHGNLLWIIGEAMLGKVRMTKLE